MDRRVKERLLGASILVVIIVLIVPELLSGPASAPAASPPPVSAPQPVRNVTVDLATSKPALEPSADVDVAVPGAAPLPAPPAASPVPKAMTFAPLETAPPPPTSVATGTKPVISGRGWIVQLGSFARRDNADNLARQAKAQGFAVFVSPGGSGSSLRYRVRTGPLADHGAASQAVAKLKSLGLTSSIVSPGR